MAGQVNIKYIICGALMIISHSAFSAISKIKRCLIVLDCSTSMLHKWSDDKNRYQIATEFIINLVDSAYAVDSTIEFGLFCFGHKHQFSDNSCNDSNFEVLFSRDNRAQINLRLENLKPIGSSPITNTFKTIRNSVLTNTRLYNYEMILISDGGESCGLNLCDIITAIKKQFQITVSIVDVSKIKYFTKVATDCIDNYYVLEDEYSISNTYKTVIKQHHNNATTKGEYGFVSIERIIPISKLALFYFNGTETIELRNLQIDLSNTKFEFKLASGKYILKWADVKSIGLNQLEFEIIPNSKKYLLLE